MKKLLCCLLLLVLAWSFAMAEEIQVNDLGLDLLGSSVHYPQLTGMPDEALQAQINADILAGGHIEERLSRMAMLVSSPVKLNVTYAYALRGEVLTCAFLADGAVENSRATQVWSAANIDLTTGETITLADVFTDVDAAKADIVTYIEERVVPELSAHLAAGELTALPDTFSLTAQGITLHYPIEQYRTLTDGAGTVTLLWSEVQEHLRLEEGSVLARLGAAENLTLDAGSLGRIGEALAAGGLPGIPLTLGENVQALIDRHGEASDPDLYEGGRLVALDGGAFRQVWLLTDALTDAFDASVVQGVRADRLNLHGLLTGVTTQDAWRAALGEPDTTLRVDEARADSWRIQPGTSDYYTIGDCRLRLHADEAGVLRSIFLMEN